MTQFRAIPIEWGLSKEPYHKFLMWASFRATFNGWGRCDALQVSFTVREAAIALDAKRSTVSDWINKARNAGLLLPTDQFVRESGHGEVYDLGGMMLQTVKATGQGPDNNRTTTGQAGVAVIGTYDVSPDNNRTTTGQGPDNTIYTSNTPTTTTRQTRKTKASGTPPIPDELMPFLEQLRAEWPRKDSLDPKRRVTIIKPEEIWHKIHQNRMHDSPRDCINAGLAYLDTSPTQYVIGMDNFFGRERKYTKYVLED